jgi:hypothetical protein
MVLLWREGSSSLAYSDFSHDGQNGTSLVDHLFPDEDALEDCDGLAFKWIGHEWVSQGDDHHRNYERANDTN